MSKFIEGDNRYQTTLFPEKLDDFVPEDSAVRVVEMFVEHLDISGLGFKAEPAETGRPGYHPRTMLKIYIYGYLNQIYSSRKLEKEASRNVELMWLTQRLAPDFKTIADFRRDNGEAIRLVCREFVMLCRKLDLLTETLVAVDGSKFKAVNNRDKNFTRAKMKRRIEEVDASIERYLSLLDDTDDQTSVAEKQSIQDKLDAMQEEMDRLKKLEVRMLEAPDKQVSLTDPDARSMKCRGNGVVGYNLQTVVDANHHLIIAHEVSSDGSDRAQLHNMSLQAKEVLGADNIQVLADRGYYSGKELLACERDNIDAIVPNSRTSNNKALGLFDRRHFIYKADDDEYECPAGERLSRRTKMNQNGMLMHRYWSSNCGQCHLKPQCSTGKERRVSRWEYEDTLERAQKRLDSLPTAMSVRRAVVEHPFGTLKQWMGSNHFLTKTRKRVSTEASLHVLSYNMKRVMKIVGTERLIEAM